jgi:hypothetical protein
MEAQRPVDRLRDANPGCCGNYVTRDRFCSANYHRSATHLLAIELAHDAERLSKLSRPGA